MKKNDENEESKELENSNEETSENVVQEEHTEEKGGQDEQEEQDVSDLSREELEQEIIELKKENDKYYKHLQRTAAEFDNYKKRVSKEKDEIYNLAIGDTVAKYVNVLDNIDRALAIENADEKMLEGIALIKKQMLEIMTSLGCTEIPTVGETFNPEVHDAVMHIESEDYGEQQVVEELRKGYKCGERVIRHAMVKVAN
jgi:molecular chaperone GrpE